MKKISYNTKSREALQADLAALQGTMHTALTKSRDGKTTSEYKMTRKNIARVLTALNALPKETLASKESTNSEK